MCNSKDHFKGKDAVSHIAEVQAKGMLTSSEIHGAETPGSLFAALDAAREMVIACLLIVLLAGTLLPNQLLSFLISFASAFAVWKFGRAAWLAWSRLERLHRVMAEEKHEIDFNRAQEREELKALYRLKGFQGKLLDDVIDVLMADGDRALRVMLEEELGFRLEENEHPLLQGFGALIGAAFASTLVIVGYYFFGVEAAIFACALVFIFSGCLCSRIDHNKSIPAILWNMGIGLFAYIVAVYCLQFMSS